MINFTGLHCFFHVKIIARTFFYPYKQAIPLPPILLKLIMAYFGLFLVTYCKIGFNDYFSAQKCQNTLIFGPPYAPITTILFTGVVKLRMVSCSKVGGWEGQSLIYSALVNIER